MCSFVFFIDLEIFNDILNINNKIIEEIKMKHKIKSIFTIFWNYIKYLFKIILSPFASVILIIYGLFCGIFKGSTQISNDLQNKNNVNLVINKIRKHLNKVPKIFLYPFGAIINICYNLTRNFYKSIENFFQKRDAVNNHTKKLIQEAVSAIIRGETNLLNSFSRRKVTKLFTALLQFTSFITTFGGFVFLLGNLNPIAPIMVAIVVQGGCYYLLNYNSSSKHTGVVKRGVLLALLVVLSMTTSYIGIFNTISNPVEYMKGNYTEYQEFYNKTVDGEIENSNFEEFNSSRIESNFNSFSNLISEAQSKVDAANEIIENTPVTRTETSNYVDVNGNYRRATSDIPIIENQTIVNEQTNFRNELSAKMDSFQNSIDGLDSDSVYLAYTELISNYDLIEDSSNEFVKIYSNFQNAISQAKDLIRLMKSNYSVDELNITEVSKSNDYSKKLLELKLSNYDNLMSDLNDDSIVSNAIGKIKEFADKGNGLIISNDLIKAEQIKIKINDEINNSYSLLIENISNDTVANDLIEMRNKCLIVNTQALPFYLPFNEIDTYLSEAIISTIIAVFTDSIALLFSIALLPRRKSSLYFDKVEKMLKIKEEMIEDCLMYICMDKISKDYPNKGLNMNSFDKVADLVAETINDVMKSFMYKVKLCYIPSQLNAYGYLDDDTINTLDEYQKSIFVTLCNISMIQAFHRDELLMILHDDFNISKNPDEIKANTALIEKYERQFAEDKIYYIVSRNIHVWFYDNFSELLESSISPDASNTAIQSQSGTVPNANNLNGGVNNA